MNPVQNGKRKFITQQTRRARHILKSLFLFRCKQDFKCLGITKNCINSYQFIISLCCSYMFRQQSVDRCAPGRHIIYTQSHTTQNFINQKQKFTCNSEGTDELPEDSILLPKHVGAAK
jgi:hypothetical protein